MKTISENSRRGCSCSRHLNDQNEAIRGASGWDGDRYAVVNTPQGPGIVWLTVWDSHVEAGEFYDLAGQAIEKRFSTKADRRIDESRQEIFLKRTGAPAHRRGDLRQTGGYFTRISPAAPTRTSSIPHK